MSDDDLVAIVQDFRDGILGGRDSESMCYAVSAPLQSYLTMIGVDCCLAVGDVRSVGHYWIELADGRIIDPTADQFATVKRPMPKVYLGRKPKHYKIVNGEVV